MFLRTELLAQCRWTFAITAPPPFVQWQYDILKLNAGERCILVCYSTFENAINPRKVGGNVKCQFYFTLFRKRYKKGGERVEEYLNVYRCFYRVVGQLVARREFLTYQRQTSNPRRMRLRRQIGQGAAGGAAFGAGTEHAPGVGRCGPGRSGAGNRREYDGAGPHSKSDSLPARSGFPCQRFYLLK